MSLPCEEENGLPGTHPGYDAQERASVGAEPSAAFTPGPWELAPATCYIGDDPVPHGWTGVSGGNWFDFALVCTRMADDAFDHPQGVANARLIAAAPDMRGALVLAARTFRQYEAIHRAKGTEDGNLKAHANAEMAEVCEAALSKAEGK